MHVRRPVFQSLRSIANTLMFDDQFLPRKAGQDDKGSRGGLQGRRKSLMFDSPTGAPSTNLNDHVIVSACHKKSKPSDDFPFSHFDVDITLETYTTNNFTLLLCLHFNAYTTKTIRVNSFNS